MASLGCDDGSSLLVVPVPGTPGPSAGARLVPLGDSITLAGGSETWIAASYHATAALLSRGSIKVVENAGVSGDTAANMLERFDTDVTPYNPTMVSVMAGINDATASVTLASYAATIRLIVAKIRAIGALPILLTPTPYNAATSEQRLLILDYRDWLTYYAGLEGIPLVDMFPIISDPTQVFKLIPAYDYDGMHPNSVGQFAMGQAFWAALSGVIDPDSYMPSVFVSDPRNMWLNGTAATNTGGVATSWFLGNAGAGTTTKSIVNDPWVPGNMQRIAQVGTSGAVALAQQIFTTGFSIGDRLRFSGVITTDGLVGNQIYFVGYTAGAVVTFLLGQEIPSAFSRGVFELEMTVPALTTQVYAYVTPLTGTGVTDLGCMTVTNLTTRQILTV